ncbi:MAG: sugar transferase, partial [Verrucomicrobiae bacterium]|nr:sugar transferase [Verrucomicrobiae bacterium]
MNVDPAVYWTRANEAGEVERWSRDARRKMIVWRATMWIARAMKRGLDILGSLGALCAFSPVFAITALLIKLEDRGPVFFCQKRVGAGGRLFGMWKFRSMVVNADQIKDALLAENQHGQSGVTFKMKNDPRITKVGRWIRKLSIDEFPQFYNVLRGDMSLVGPRPPLPREVAEYKASHLRRLRVKPGITCLWQIGGRSEIDFDGQVRLDLQ